MIKFEEHTSAVEALNAAQEADGDNRDRLREAHLFLNSRNGQWEPDWWEKNNNKPRYTFDMTTPIVDQIAGALEGAEFDIRVTPSGGNASKDDAKLLDGIVRNIENISNAKAIYNLAARAVVTGGLSGWCVKQKFVDDNSFEQDLVIDPIANFADSVWPGPFKKPDASDMKYCFVLEGIAKDEYEERWPDGSGQSLSQNRIGDAFDNKVDQIIVGQAYWITEKPRTLNLMSDGRVLEDSEEFKMVADELAQNGITVVNSRVVKKKIVKTRLFDAGGWLTDEQETVFNEIPVIVATANFEIFEDKLLYHGVVEKLIDPQRVFNYSKSREIEEGALAPRAKYWMTPKQAAGHEKKLATLNTNADPVQFFNIDPENPGPPQQNGGAQINPGLANISQNMQEIMRGTAGLYAANMGDNPNAQSGVAIEKLQSKGDAGSIKYFQAMELAIARTGRILVNAIPKVYDTERTIRILKEDGSFDMQTLNQVVVDVQTGQRVVLNDITKGKYDVTCKAGPSFDSRQQETVSALTEMAQVDPTIIELGGDILYNNLTSPGMDLLAERKRQQLFQAGLIPQEQLTEEEQMLMQQVAQQEPPPDPAMLMAQAEMEKARADNENNQVKMAIEQQKLQLQSQDMQLKQLELQVRAREMGVKESEAQVKFLTAQTDSEAQQLENRIAAMKFGIEVEGEKAKVDETRSKTTKNIADATKTVKETQMMGMSDG
jgi:hypothetical protein